ncbi:MAG: cellulase family glycosylhydrolase [Maribacter sp.]
MKFNRTLYRVFLILSFLAVNALILVGVSSVFSYLNTGADRATILHLPKELLPNYLPKVEWAPLANEGRPMELPTLAEIERDYLKAWYVRSIALETNEPYGIADYYTDSARVKLFDILDLNKQNNSYFKSTTLRHHPKLEFYSADGKIAVLTDENVELYEEAYIKNEPISQHTEIASYQVMLILEDGFWRIRHFVKLPQKKMERPDISKPEMMDVSNIKGINYYPQKNPWNMYGTGFNDSTINDDFKKIKTLKLNTVRIFVPYETFGKAEVVIEKVDQLKQTLDLAAKNDLKVIVTLFDFYGDYSLRDWTLTHRHAEQIVKELRNHKALLAWDIKNEPDLDFETRGKTRVIAWLQQMLLEVKACDKKHPVTIGWSSPKAATNLAEETDFVSFHYYREPSQFKEAFSTLKANVFDKPIVLQEYGYSSYDGIWNGYLGSEEDQAEYFDTMQALLEEEKVPYLFWTLYDFKSVPNSVVGRIPWRKAQQKHFGLLDTKKRQKKAYRSLVQEK